jgi:hypothetical protein
MSRKLTNDDIGMMPNEELENRHQSLVSYIERERRKNKPHPELEIEACYFAREIEHRAIVRKNHLAWLEKNRSNFGDM